MYLDGLGFIWLYVLISTFVSGGGVGSNINGAGPAQQGFGARCWLEPVVAALSI